MRTTPTREKAAEARRGERGAALVTTMLLCTLLLLAGGALIVKTSGSVGVAFDATSEMQAYYAAEAGLQSALNILRGNHQNPAGDKATFQKVVADGGTLGAWLDYDGATGRVMVGDHAYSVVVTDASVPPVAAGAAPQRLLITSTGYGPRGSRKELALLLRSAAEIEVPGAVTLRGAPGGGGMTFALGNSNGRTFLSDDPTKPVFVTTNGPDQTQVNNWINGDDKSKTQFSEPSSGDTSAGTAQLPSFLASPAAAEALIEDLKALDTPGDNIKIVEGDYSMKSGSGILVVTGTLDLGGNSNFEGIALVLGEGQVTWGGQGVLTGALFIAKYDRDDLTKDFEAPTLNINGAGKSNISYSSSVVAETLNMLGFRILGVQEQ